MLEFSIITISSAVTVLNDTVKNISTHVFNKDISRYIPIFSVLFGILLGVAGFYLTDVDMGENVVEAIFIGIAAGSAATGVNQISKQLNKTPKNKINVDSLFDEVIAENIMTEEEDIIDKEESVDEDTTQNPQ